MSAALDYPWAEIGTGGAGRLLPGLEWIRLPLPFPPRHVNVYRFEGGDGPLLVDTGYADEETDRAWDGIGMPPASRVLVTHFHPDHVGQAARLERAGARVFMPPAELAKGRSLAALAGDAVQESLRSFFAAHELAVPREGLGRGNGYRRAVPELPDAAPLEPGPFRADESFEIRSAGGHSPAHALAVHAGLGVIAAGDILLPTISPNVSVWPDDPDADPLGRYLGSLESLRDLPSDIVVLPAHGRPYRGVHARIRALAAHHEERLDLVRSLANRRSVTGADVVARMFAPDLKASSLPFALGEAVAHLNRLWHAGEIDRVRDAGGVYRYAR